MNKTNQTIKKEDDILIMLSSLSNHEIFTPPHLANSMLDLLPKEIFTKPEYKFLDPSVKTGVFLREIVIRLNEGLKDKGNHIGFDGKKYNLNNKQERLNHIFKNMIFGIAISELTSYIARRTLYGVMEANSEKFNSFVDSLEILSNENKITEEKKFKQLDRTVFNDYYDYKMFQNDKNYKDFEKEGNIFYPILEVSEENEDVFFPFIDEVKHSKINEIKKQIRFNKITNKEEEMKFDVVIGNPPYQVNDGGGHGDSAKPIYNLFVENAIKMNPRYISMIIPSRWMKGGKGLDKFRKNMMKDTRIEKIYDFQNDKDIFQNVNVDGGINYFLWNKNYNGKCNYFYKSMSGIEQKNKRFLKTNISDTVIRDNYQLSIISKSFSDNKFNDIVSESKPYGIRTYLFNNPERFGLEKISKTFFENSVEIFGVIGNKGGAKRISGFIPIKLMKKRKDNYKNYKLFFSKGYSQNSTVPPKIIIGNENQICTETFLQIGSFKTLKEAQNCLLYIKTKFFRALLFYRKGSFLLKKDTFSYIPNQDFSIEWTDEKLYKKYNLTKDEIDYIETNIKEMD